MALLRKYRVGQEGSAGGRAQSKGQECVRAVAIPACGSDSVCGEEGCGQSCITLPGTRRWHGQHGAAGGDGMPAATLSGLGCLGSVQTNSGVVCSANTAAGSTNTRPARAGCSGTHWLQAGFGPRSSQEWGQMRPQLKSHLRAGQCVRAGPRGAGTCLMVDGLGAEAEELRVLDPSLREVGWAALPVSPTVPKYNQSSPLPIPCPKADS